MKRKFLGFGLAFTLALIVGLVITCLYHPVQEAPDNVIKNARVHPAQITSVSRTKVSATSTNTNVTVSRTEKRARDLPTRDEADKEKQEEEALRRIEAFDALTDTWMEPASRSITFDDVQKFVNAFREVPNDHQDECIHRALNLICDENIMLLVGILMDKSFSKDVLEAIHADVLNRDEQVKIPILQQIFQDRKHPCWADTAWILDVTDQKPKARKKP